MKGGYSLIKNTMDETALLKVWRDLHFIVVKQLERFSVMPSMDMKTNLEMLLHADMQVYISALSLASRLKSVSDLFSGFFNAGVYAFPSAPVLHIMADGLKIPDGYWGTEAHQDWASTQGSLDVTTVWIPITNTIGNFPLEVLPDSHLNGFLGGKENGSVLEVECEGGFEEVPAQFGDAVKLSGFIVHRTSKSGNGLRIAVSMRFENVNELTFIERGYPCAQKRVVDRAISWQPTIEQVANVG